MTILMISCAENTKIKIDRSINTSTPLLVRPLYCAETKNMHKGRRVGQWLL